VSQTIIRYDNKELLQLIHNHLNWSGLHNTAAVLAKEASLYVPTTTSASIFTTPKGTHRSVSVVQKTAVGDGFDLNIMRLFVIMCFSGRSTTTSTLLPVSLQLRKMLFHLFAFFGRPNLYQFLITLVLVHAQEWDQSNFVNFR